MAPIRKKPRVSRRLRWLSKPRQNIDDIQESAILLSGVRKAALKSVLTERVQEASYPCVRRLMATQEQFGHVLTERCKAALSENIENSNGTVYARILRQRGRSGLNDSSDKRHRRFHNEDR